jgi:hypothetical protein
MRKPRRIELAVDALNAAALLWLSDVRDPALGPIDVDFPKELRAAWNAVMRRWWTAENIGGGSRDANTLWHDLAAESRRVLVHSAEQCYRALEEIKTA